MAHVCAKCGSAKIIPGVPLQDCYGDIGAYSQPAAVAVAGNPQAWVLKDQAKGEIRADICGDCGYMELHATNCRELYQKYAKARGLGDEPRQ